MQAIAARGTLAARRRKAAGGFTLIELVTVMLIVAILSAIAIPSYFQFIARGKRSEARATLTHAAQWMERWRTENGSYLPSPPALPASLGSSPPPPSAPAYLITAVSTAATYTLTATPTGTMNGDGCGNLTLNSTGLRDRTGALDFNLCWGR